MPVKKTTKAKTTSAKSKTTKSKTAPAKKSTAKSAPATKKTSTKPAAKTTKGRGKTTKVDKPKSNRGGFNRELNEETGFVVGTDQDVIANALLEGGDSRAAICEAIEGQIDMETRTGNTKQVPNMVSGVLNRMLARGFTVESSYRVVPPTPASKRAATRAANAKGKAAPAKKTAAKKSPTKTTTKKTTTKSTAKKGKAASKRK